MELCIVEICSYGRCPKVADLNVLCTDILGRDGGSIVIVLNALLYNERRKLTLIIGYLLVNCIFSREKHCLRGEMHFSKIPLWFKHIKREGEQNIGGKEIWFNLYV